jgi:hypothetical protein
MNRPMLKMGVWSWPVAGSNGAVVQYTINDGVKWETIGDLNSGINWYNSASIRSQPGGQLNGWSKDPMADWAVARHSLDNLIGQKNVRFRIAFAADGLAVEQFDGFAFDDIWIGNREQNLLLEYFTNATLASTVQPNASMRTLEENNKLDVVAVHYHTAYPTGDPMHSLYSTGASSREYYYGISGIPYALANGTKQFDFTTFANNQSTIINIERLKDPRMAIDVTGSATGSLDVNVSVKALEALSNQELILQCAVVQEQYDVQAAIQGQTKFYNVIRQFLPDPGGTQLKANWNVDDTESKSLSWQIPAGVDKDGLRVLAFVQNIDTREIYQVGMYDVSGLTSAKPITESFAVKLYPNPATSFVRIVSPQVIEQATVVDVSGRVLKVFEPNSDEFEISLDEFKSGLYILNIKNSKGTAVAKFIKK